MTHAQQQQQTTEKQSKSKKSDCMIFEGVFISCVPHSTLHAGLFDIVNISHISQNNNNNQKNSQDTTTEIATATKKHATNKTHKTPEATTNANKTINTATKHQRQKSNTMCV